MDQCPQKLELESQRIASTPCMHMEACNVDALITTNPQYQVPKTVCNRDVGLDVDLNRCGLRGGGGARKKLEL